MADPDYVVVYDRATTGHAGRTKQLNLALIAAPTISGNTATAVSGGQKVTVQSLLPAGATIAEQHFWKTDPSQEMDLVAELSPSTNRLVIADPKKPVNTRFLTVVQGTDSTAKAAVATTIHSTAGTAFDGAVVANTAVIFPVTAADNIATTTFSVPAAVTRVLITGLQRSKGYNVTIGAVSGGSKAVKVTTGSTLKSDDGGVLGVGFPASKSPTQTGYVAGFKKLSPM